MRHRDAQRFFSKLDIVLYRPVVLVHPPGQELLVQPFEGVCSKIPCSGAVGNHEHLDHAEQAAELGVLHIPLNLPERVHV